MYTAGITGGLSLFLNVEHYEYMLTSEMSAGFWVLVHDQGVPSKEMSRLGRLLAPGSKTAIAIRKTKVTNTCSL